MASNRLDEYIQDQDEAIEDVRMTLLAQGLDFTQYDLKAIVDEVYFVRHDGCYLPVGTVEEFDEIVEQNKKS